MKKLFALTAICLLSQIFFVVYAQEFTRNLAGGGKLSWVNSFPFSFTEDDVSEFVKILETGDDYIQIVTELVDGDEFSEDGYKKIIKTTINIKGNTQLEKMYNQSQKKLVLDAQLEMLKKVNSYILKSARQLQDNQYNRFISTARTYTIEYTANIGKITLFAGTPRNEDGEVKLYQPYNFTVMGETAQIYPNMIEGKPTQVTLGKAYDTEMKKHLPAYFVYYMYNDHHALHTIPAYNEKFIDY